ncbi:MAG: AraC family transcriptional regulator [Prevotellaceae bacterium]|nr:AraC family transcriptional regulator [Prevotellaceae bacterium]
MKTEQTNQLAHGQLLTGGLYNMVCSDPAGGAFHLDFMPEWLDTDPQDNHLPHVHTFYEILWFQKAGGTHTVDFSSYPVEANSLFLLCPGQVHHFDGVTRHKGVLLRFCTDFLQDDASDDSLLRSDMFNVFEPSPYCVVRDSVCLAKMSELVGKMQDELPCADAFAHMEMIRSLAKIFLILIHRNGERQGTPHLDAMKASHRLFLRFRQMVEQRYTTLHTVQDYARELGTSLKSLSVCVRECSGKSPLAFINSRIVLEAKRLSAFSSLMVKEIAYYLGYDDPSYFMKFFKRETGYLPSDFRKWGSSEQAAR